MNKLNKVDGKNIRNYLLLLLARIFFVEDYALLLVNRNSSNRPSKLT